MKSVNPKNQATVTKAINWLTKYNKANDLRDLAENNDDDKAFSKWDKKCESAWDKYQDFCAELPAREVKEIEKSDLY
jgi:hypothetical protein